MSQQLFSPFQAIVYVLKTYLQSETLISSSYYKHRINCFSVRIESVLVSFLFAAVGLHELQEPSSPLSESVTSRCPRALIITQQDANRLSSALAAMLMF